jgi:maltodextrin utilization protein YvdJ
MLSILGGVYDKLVSDVADAVISKMKAETQAVIALDPETLRLSVIDLLNNDDQTREAVCNASVVYIDDQIEQKVEDAMNDFDFDSKVDDIVDQKLTDFEVNFSGGDFEEAVKTVIRDAL